MISEQGPNRSRDSESSDITLDRFCEGLGMGYMECYVLPSIHPKIIQRLSKSHFLVDSSAMSCTFSVSS